MRVAVATDLFLDPEVRLQRVQSRYRRQLCLVLTALKTPLGDTGTQQGYIKLLGANLPAYIIILYLSILSS